MHTMRRIGKMERLSGALNLQAQPEGLTRMYPTPICA